MGKQKIETQERTKYKKLAKNAKILKVIVAAIQEKKGENILSLDLRKIEESVGDFFIICEASSTTQVKAIGDHVQEQVKEKCKESPFKVEGYDALNWIILDYVNVVVHIMLPNIRGYYKLEELWSDGVESAYADPAQQNKKF